jgi:hypothetical protein
MSTVSYPHIEQRQNGKLYIAGTPIKVRQIALDHVAYGWGAAEIQREHPQLTASTRGSSRNRTGGCSSNRCRYAAGSKDSDRAKSGQNMGVGHCVLFRDFAEQC